MGVGVAAEVQRPVRAALGHQPHLAGAAAHLVGLRVLRLVQGLQALSQLDDVAVAVFPVLQEFELRRQGVQGLVDGSGHGRQLGGRGLYRNVRREILTAGPQNGMMNTHSRFGVLHSLPVARELCALLRPDRRR